MCVCVRVPNFHAYKQQKETLKCAKFLSTVRVRAFMRARVVCVCVKQQYVCHFSLQENTREIAYDLSCGKFHQTLSISECVFMRQTRNILIWICLIKRIHCCCCWIGLLLGCWFIWIATHAHINTQRMRSAHLPLSTKIMLYRNKWVTNKANAN